MKDFESEKEGVSGAGSATGIFGTVDAASAPRTPPAPSAIPVNLHEVVFSSPHGGAAKPIDPLQRMMQSTPAPVPTFAAPQPPPAPSGAGGFTQMLRMLSADESKAPSAAGPTPTPVSGSSNRPSPPDPAAAPPAGGFTDLFGTLPTPLAVPGVEGGWVAVSESASPQPSAATPSLTSMFVTVQPPPAPAAMPNESEPVFSQPAKSKPTEVATPQAAGGFTQLFRALDAKVDPGTGEDSGYHPGHAAITPAATPSVPAAASGRVFSSPPVQLVAPPVAAPARQSDGFTQLLRSIDPDTLQTPPLPSSPVFSQRVPAPAANSSNSLTSLFQGLEAAQAAAVSTPTAPASTAPPSAYTSPPQPAVTKSFEPFVALERVPTPSQSSAGPQGAGAFTQMFQSLGSAGQMPETEVAQVPFATTREPSRVPQAAPAQGGSFTQMFAGISSLPAAPPSQADHFPPVAPPPVSHDAGGFSAPTPTTAYSAPRFSEPVFRDAAPVAAWPRAETPAAGGSLTQLLRTLDSPAPTPSSAPGAFSSSSEPPSSAFEPMPSASALPSAPMRAPYAQPGATTAFQLPSSNIAPTTPSGAQGPGEFTTILNANALRESLRQGGSAASTPPPQSPTAAANPWAAPAYPPMPQMPGYPPAPQAPALSPIPGFGAAPMQPMQMQAMQPPQMQAPPMPALAASPAALASAKSWLPILLIVIIVLLVGILVAVVLLMKK